MVSVTAKRKFEKGIVSQKFQQNIVPRILLENDTRKNRVSPNKCNNRGKTSMRKASHKHLEIICGFRIHWKCLLCYILQVDTEKISDSSN